MSKVLNNSRLPLILIIAAAFTFMAACSKSGSTTSSASGPAAAARTYFEAITRKDFAAARKYLSAATASKMEAEAKEHGKSLEEAWRDSAAKTSGGKMPEIGDEKITGDTATVDIKDKERGMAFPVPMVKEGGEWKIALDKVAGNNRILAVTEPAASPAATPTPAEDKDEEKGEGDEGHSGHEEK